MPNQKNQGRKPVNGHVACRVYLMLSCEEQKVVERLAVAQTKWGPIRISATEVVRGLIRKAARSRR